LRKSIGFDFYARLTFDCQVIVGTNGSGKSTMLKLMLRLYDPTEGAIFVNGQDIKTLKLVDLRESMAVLFQDYTHFPLTVRLFLTRGLTTDNVCCETDQRQHWAWGSSERA
jgi:ABC-type multidrug transport system fused ATPase/permease subunit